ncbi:transmembrane protein 45B-like [Glandiceps talaboti]
MGNWRGHIVPGISLFVIGFYWAIKYSYRSVTKKTTALLRHNGDESSPMVLGRGRMRLSNIKKCPSEFWEGVALICFWVIGVMVEMSAMGISPYQHIAMFDDSTPGRLFIWGNKWLHITIYTFFMIYGIALIFARTCVPGLRDHEKIFIALAYFVEGILFYFHIHERTSLDTIVHYMPVITSALNTIFALAETWKKDDVLFPFISTLFLMVQGTWFWQVAYILYPPNIDAKFDEDNHANVMFVTFAYCWHIAANLFIIAGVYGVVSSCVHLRENPSLSRYNLHVDHGDMETELGLMDHPSDDDTVRNIT